jgi:sugar/nucleoside kinase (ribokinase family)
MIKRFEITALCNPIVDLLVSVEEDWLKEAAIEQGSFRLCEADVVFSLLKETGKEPTKVSGGSFANSLIACSSYLEVNNSENKKNFALLGGLGRDPFGDFYATECNSLRIETPLSRSDLPTGQCLSLITSNGERSMRTALGASLSLSEAKIKEPAALKAIQESHYLAIEGYVFLNGEDSKATIKEALSAAEREDTKVILSLSDPFVVASARQAIIEILPKVSILFGNEYELIELYQTREITDESVLQNARHLNELVPLVVITRGARGSLVCHEGKVIETPAIPTSVVVDATGAGDVFAGSFLGALLNNKSIKECSEIGGMMAKRVISQVGSRLDLSSFKL